MFCRNIHVILADLHVLSQYSCGSSGITRFVATFVWFYDSSFVLALIIHYKHMIELTSDQSQDPVGVLAVVIWTKLPKWYTDVSDASLQLQRNVFYDNRRFQYVQTIPVCGMQTM